MEPAYTVVSRLLCGVFMASPPSIVDTAIVGRGSFVALFFGESGITRQAQCAAVPNCKTRRGGLCRKVQSRTQFGSKKILAASNH